MNNSKKNALMNFMVKYSAKIDLVVGLALIIYGTITTNILLQMFGAISILLSILAPVKKFKEMMDKKLGKVEQQQ